MVRKRKQEKFTCFYHIFRGKKTKSKAKKRKGKANEIAGKKLTPLKK